MVRLRVLTADKRMPPGDASAGFGETLRIGRREEKKREKNPQHKSNIHAREIRFQDYLQTLIEDYENARMDADISNQNGIINTSFTSGSAVILEVPMPQKVICSECAHVLYESGILKSPQEIAKRFEGRCPSCRKILKFSFESLSIYPYEEKDDK